LRDKKHKPLAIALIVLLCLGLELAAQQPSNSANWARWEFLKGEWVGEGSGGPGQGSGEFSFLPELQGKILVRHSRADYPATRERPAYSHTDLLVIYVEPDTNSERAIYFDNEGHVIHYSIKFSADGKSVEFLSDSMASAARYRLTYTQKNANTVAIRFEIAPPGKPEMFATYIDAQAHRKGH
jgi:hypothetical protein